MPFFHTVRMPCLSKICPGLYKNISNLNILFLKVYFLRAERFLESLGNLLASLVFVYNLWSKQNNLYSFFIISSGSEQKSAKMFPPKSLSALEGISLTQYCIYVNTDVSNQKWILDISV